LIFTINSLTYLTASWLKLRKTFTTPARFAERLINTSALLGVGCITQKVNLNKKREHRGDASSYIKWALLTPLEKEKSSNGLEERKD
jgi:hypothetical protein